MPHMWIYMQHLDWQLCIMRRWVCTRFTTNGLWQQQCTRLDRGFEMVEVPTATKKGSNTERKAPKHDADKGRNSKIHWTCSRLALKWQWNQEHVCRHVRYFLPIGARAAYFWMKSSLVLVLFVFQMHAARMQGILFYLWIDEPSV